MIVQLRAFASGPCVGSIFVVGTDCCGLADLWFILWWDLGTVALLELGTVALLELCGGKLGCASWVDSFWLP